MSSNESTPIGAAGVSQAMDDKINAYAIGTWLEITYSVEGKQHDAIEKGTLKSVDGKNRTLVIHNRNYDEDRSISLDRITSIASFEEQQSGTLTGHRPVKPADFSRPDGPFLLDVEPSDG